MLAARSSKAGNRKPSSGASAIWPVEALWKPLSSLLYFSSSVGAFTGQTLHTKYLYTVSDPSENVSSSRPLYGTS